MRFQGRISGWKDEQGFGFVVPNGGGQQAFVHVKAFKPGQKRPLGNELITYELAFDPMGRPQAEQIAFVERGRQKRPTTEQRVGLHWFAALFMLALGGAVFMGKLPLKVLGFYAAISALTFVVYAVDKSRAQNGGWRTSEATLHMLALMGGWPGAACAQRLLRHKSSKQAFQVVYLATVVLNCAALVWLSVWGRAQSFW